MQGDMPNGIRHLFPDLLRDILKESQNPVAKNIIDLIESLPKPRSDSRKNLKKH
jgi:hypothetical protein